MRDDSFPIDLAVQTAIEHHRAGRLTEAESLYREVLGWQPNHGDALRLLGALATQAGKPEAAVRLLERVIALEPGNGEAHSDLGRAFQAMGRVEEAIRAHRRALELQPQSADACNNLANALARAGRIEEAVARYREALRIRPGYAQVHSNLGNALQTAGRLEEAEASHREALRLEPRYAEAHFNLGNVLQARGRLDEAIKAYSEAVGLMPERPAMHNNLGSALKARGWLPEAIASFEEALRLDPHFAAARNNLGNALLACSRVDEAVVQYRRALDLEPDSLDALANLGNCYNYLRRFGLAVECYRKAAALHPRSAAIHSNLIYALHFDPDSDSWKILDESREWARLHGNARRASVPPHPNDCVQERRLRIGYVSPDFRDHVVGRIIYPLLREHDRRSFEIYCYANVLAPDSVTSDFHDLCDHWRDIAGVSDERAAEIIRADRLDILVDLALHTAHNRLPLFSHKPAPIQVCHLGYAGTTGLDAIDYRLSDPYLDPPGSDLSCYREKTVRLPRTTWCYEPVEPTPEVSALPALQAGFVSFGCRNNISKVSDPALHLWMEILQAVPNSRLKLLAPPGSCRQAMLEQLAHRNYPVDRLDFVNRERREDFLRNYAQVDVALDPFPYCGWYTTGDALWMGAPVVTLSGRTAVGRGGRSILSNVGLPELVAETPRQYLEIAAGLARDLPRLSALRVGLRERMNRSPLRDFQGFAREIEAAYRAMWQEWCASR